MDNQKQPKNRLKKTAILTGVAFQMGITIYLFVQAGKWLDQQYSNGGKLYAVILTLAGVFGSIYLVLRQLKSINEE